MLKEMKLKENKTDKACYVSALPNIEDMPPDVLSVFIRSYEQTIFTMFAHKRTKRNGKKYR